MSTWIKVYNSMPAHPKLLMAGDRAAWLFVCGCCYANEHLTDGYIARRVLPVAAPGVKNTEQLADRLVDANLWHEVDGGWRIHDYSDVQRSSDQVREQRARDAKRKADTRAMSNGSPRGQIADSDEDSARESEKCPRGVRDVRVEESREEKKTALQTSSLRSDVSVCFEYWQERCGHGTAKLSADRRGKIEARLREGYTTGQIRKAIDGAALSPFIDGKGKRHDDIELICRTGSKLEDFMGRANLSPVQSGEVLPFGRRESASDLIRAIRGDVS